MVYMQGHDGVLPHMELFNKVGVFQFRVRGSSLKCNTRLSELQAESTNWLQADVRIYIHTELYHSISLYIHIHVLRYSYSVLHVLLCCPCLVQRSVSIPTITATTTTTTATNT